MVSVRGEPTSAIYDCAIVGAGPAGLTAGLYLTRFHRHVAIIDRGHSRAAAIPRTHNYPGFPDGVAGTELLGLMRDHLARMEGSIVSDTVVSIERCGSDFTLQLASNVSLGARAVILCSGVQDIEPELPGTAEAIKAGVLRQCPICDGYEYTDKHIAILGDSQHSVNEAVFLRDFTAAIDFFSVARQPLQPALQEQLGKAGIRLVEGSPIGLEVAANQTVTVVTDRGCRMQVAGVYSALGVKPVNGLALSLGTAVDECGNVIVDAHCQTSVPHVYAAGDLVSGLHQISVSAGQAAIAATAIHNRLPPHRQRAGVARVSRVYPLK